MELTTAICRSTSTPIAAVAVAIPSIGVHLAIILTDMNKNQLKTRSPIPPWELE